MPNELELETPAGAASGPGRERGLPDGDYQKIRCSHVKITLYHHIRATVFSTTAARAESPASVVRGVAGTLFRLPLASTCTQHGAELSIRGRARRRRDFLLESAARSLFRDNLQGARGCLDEREGPRERLTGPRRRIKPDLLSRRRRRTADNTRQKCLAGLRPPLLDVTGVVLSRASWQSRRRAQRPSDTPTILTRSGVTSIINLEGSRGCTFARFGRGTFRQDGLEFAAQNNRNDRSYPVSE